MLRNALSVLGLCVLFAGCASHSAQSVAYDPANDARIRVYFGTDTHFYFNTSCEPKKHAFDFASRGTAVAKPRLLNLANTTIGMPVPEDAYRYYDEYVVKANEPLTITLDTGGTSQTGGVVFSTPREHAAGTFVPQAGKDYEAFAIHPSGYLRLEIRRLIVEDDRVRTESIGVKHAPLCEDAAP
ncbi:hypothetical protein [Burkholderia sp. RF4-BP95]|uniref:hypothetical protein n=1 Tax=Burkholderia sp. RF4-BP95 TaxID=1637845 RepID=UPI000757670E|nr:hypothetical protein [Burkholderia sp. RF4-BP95]KUY83336.1 hypothetical protein WS46_12055 [Burkholderia sp. RF4-BP95]